MKISYRARMRAQDEVVAVLEHTMNQQSGTEQEVRAFEMQVARVKKLFQIEGES